MWAWLKNNNESVTSAAAIIGLVGLGFTYCQIRDTKHAIMANTLYEIQRDSREMLSEMDPRVYQYLTEYSPATTYDAAVLTLATKEINKIVNFYAAIKRQSDNGFVDEKFWAVMKDDFCGLLTVKPVADYWQERVVSGAYSDEFKALPKSCSGAP